MISVNKVFYAHSERFQMQNMNVHIKAGEIVSLIVSEWIGKIYFASFNSKATETKRRGHHFRWEKHSYDEEC